METEPPSGASIFWTLEAPEVHRARGEVEIDGRNLYFDEWDYEFRFDLQPLQERQK